MERGSETGTSVRREETARRQSTEDDGAACALAGRRLPGARRCYGLPAPPVTITVYADVEGEAPQVVEMRKLAELPFGTAAKVQRDTVLRTLSELQRSIGAAEDLAGVLRSAADAALVLVPRATHATLVLKDDAASSGSDNGFVPVLTRVRGADGAGADRRRPCA